jgi:hypothetical protein
MIKWENVVTNISGVFPDALAINASGAGATDGTEFIAGYINNGIFGPSQAFMDYAAGSANAPSGTVGVPNGVTEAAGASQILEAIQKAHGIGPGKGVQWNLADDPSVTGDRVLLLSNQTILIASYQELVDATYVGDGNNATAPYFYKSSDAGGVTRSTSGTYFTLPPQPSPTYLKQYSEANGDFTVTGTNWTTTRAVAVPYKTSDGAWRMILNFDGSLSVAAASLSLTVSGVTFKNVSGYTQPVTYQVTSDWASGSVNPGGSTISGNSGSVGVNWRLSGNVELDSKPTWAEDFEFVQGITY